MPWQAGCNNTLDFYYVLVMGLQPPHSSGPGFLRAPPSTVILLHHASFQSRLQHPQILQHTWPSLLHGRPCTTYLLLATQHHGHSTHFVHQYHQQIDAGIYLPCQSTRRLRVPYAPIHIPPHCCHHPSHHHATIHEILTDVHPIGVQLNVQHLLPNCIGRCRFRWGCKPQLLVVGIQRP